MPAVNEISKYFDSIVPYSTKMDFDNVGFLAGRGETAVYRVLCALDITEAVIAEAAALGAELIVSHHPLIYQPQKSVTDGSWTGRRLLALLSHNLSAVCLHTNLDRAEGGVNDALAAALGLRVSDPLDDDPRSQDYYMGRVGALEEPCTFGEFLPRVKAALKANGLRYVDAGRAVSRVAVGGGTCGSMLNLALEKDCDTFVTADIKHSQFLEAQELGLNLVDAGHFPTENMVVPRLREMLLAGFPELDVRLSAVSKQPEGYC
ncbi:MAG: Nif3-like dinuclear metal center hexameric protein [Firmicutes bacterium]|nr:Nif3-like dinuclear metal center hexameric protein [Bacillota bacterium]